MKNMTSASVYGAKDAEDRHQKWKTESGYHENARYRAVRCEGCSCDAAVLKQKKQDDRKTES